MDEKRRGDLRYDIRGGSSSSSTVPIREGKTNEKKIYQNNEIISL